MTVREAAHVDHDISADAEKANTLLTLVGGVVAGAFAGAYTGGGGVLAGAAIGCSVGGNIGVWIDRFTGTESVGPVKIGVASVLVGKDRKPAASNDPAVNQAGCHDFPIAEGSKSVNVEKWSFSRCGDQTMCGHVITEGCKSVLIGGVPVMSGDPSEFSGVLNKFVNLACQATGLLDAKGAVVDSIAIGVEMAATATDNDAIADAAGLFGGASSVGNGGFEALDGAIGAATDATSLLGY